MMYRIIGRQSHVRQVPYLIMTSFRTLSTKDSKKHYERRLLNYSCEQLFSVVSNVSEYENFVPWCTKSAIVQQNKNQLEAELCIGFGVLTEKYSSKVNFVKPSLVTAISNQTNLFEYLKTEWKFSPSSDPSKSWVTFQVDFKFRSAVYSSICDLFMQQVVNKMVQAFENRCHDLYGRKSNPKYQQLIQ